MLIDKNNGFHLSYCSNVHAAESWKAVFNNLKQYVPKLKKALAPKQPFGIGLRLSNKAADELLTGNELSRFTAWLNKNSLYVFTINGFPYGDFHEVPVKDKVYAPDWMTIERRDYCFKLIKILAALTPEGQESGFSTTPLSYKPWLNSKTDDIKHVYEQASVFFSEITAEMVKIRKETNKEIHIDIEAEPDCLIETVDELVDFFNHWLIPMGSLHLSRLLNISKEKATQHLRRHVRACYDICHSSVEFEDPHDVFSKLSDADIQIGKIQVSTALKTKLPKDSRLRKNISAHLQQFIDPVYLHQAVIQESDGKLSHYTDLNLALEHIHSTTSKELRTHFHVPIFVKQYKTLESTQNDVEKVLKLLQKNKATHHLEIETYTWDVLPDDLKSDLFSSLVREYKWVLSQFELA